VDKSDSSFRNIYRLKLRTVYTLKIFGIEQLSLES